LTSRAASSLRGICAVPDDRPLEGRHAVVTGASRGIGAAIAERLGTFGARVTLMARDHAALQTVAERVPDSAAIVCDITDAQAIARAFAEAKRCGRIAILVNNAGVAASEPFLRTDDAMLERMLAV